jgi:hypothetical protein
MMAYTANRGDVARFDAVAAHAGDDGPSVAFFLQTRGRTPAPPLWPPGDSNDAYRAGMELRRLVDLERWADATAVRERRRRAGIDMARSMDVALGLLAAGHAPRWLEERCAAQLQLWLRAGSLADLYGNIGWFAAPPLDEWFAARLDEAARAGVPELLRELLRASHQSHRHRHREALASLRRALKARLPGEPLGGPARVMVAEILARPVWLGALGRPEEKRIAAELLADPGLDVLLEPGEWTTDYWSAVKRGRWAEADALATSGFRIMPSTPLLILTRLWCRELERPAEVPALRESLRFAIRTQVMTRWLLPEVSASLRPAAAR